MPSHRPSSGAWANVQPRGTPSPANVKPVAGESPARNIGHRFLLGIAFNGHDPSTTRGGGSDKPSRPGRVRPSLRRSSGRRRAAGGSFAWWGGAGLVGGGD